jgi:hypothetical protein
VDMRRQNRGQLVTLQTGRKTGRAASPALPALAMLFELLAIIMYVSTNMGMKMVPLTFWFGLDMPYCWYVLYGFWCGQCALFVAGVWFAIREPQEPQWLLLGSQNVAVLGFSERALQ